MKFTFCVLLSIVVYHASSLTAQEAEEDTTPVVELEEIVTIYNGPQYSGHELSKIYRLTHTYTWRSEYVNQADSSYSEIQVSNSS